MKMAADLYAPGAGNAALADRQWLRAHLNDPQVRVVEVDSPRPGTSARPSTGTAPGWSSSPTQPMT